MKKILIPLCFMLYCMTASGQRTAKFNSPDILFTEGKELYELKNYAGCIDKMQAYKSHILSSDASLAQEADFFLLASLYEQGRADIDVQLKEYLETYPDTRHHADISYMIASVYFNSEEYENAIFWFGESNIDVLSAEKQEAYTYRLAYSLLQTGDTATARGYFARIQQIGKTYQQAATYYLAYIDYVDGRYDDALAAFAKMKDSAEFSRQSQYYITQIYFIQNKYERVIQDGERILASSPEGEYNTELHRIIGNSYFNTGNQAKAIEHLQQYVSSAERPLRGDLYILGVCLYNQKRYAEAAYMLGGVVTQSDELTQNAYLYLGQSYLQINDKNNARMAFEAAGTSNYDRQVREVALYNYALLIHETAFAGFGESVTVFEDFLNDFPNSKYADKVNDYLVEVYFTTKNYDAALTSINKINRPSDKILDAKQNILFQMGAQAFANAEFDKAEEFFSSAISLGSYNLDARSEAHFWRGETFYRKENFARAISDYQNYLNNTRQRNSDMYALALYGLGYSYFKQQNYREALTRFRQYINTEQNKTLASYADAYNRIGDCLYYDRKFTEAKAAYARSAELQPSAADYAIYQKGFLLGLQKDYRGKIAAMDQLVRDFPQSQYVDDALFEKGRAYVMLEEYNGAISAFNELIDKFPQSSHSRKAGVQLGLIYYNVNNLDKALAEYKKVIDRYPGSDEAKVALQDLRSVYVDMNNVQGYADYTNSLGGSVRLEISERDSLTYIAAEKLFMRGDNSGAQRSFESYIQSFPGGAFSSNANYYLASIAFSNKNYDSALSLFERVLDSGDVKFREDAMARRAEIEYMNKDYAAALESFRTLQVIAEKAENKYAARLGMMRSALFSNQQNEALKAATELLADQRLSPEIEVEARYVRAKAYIALEQDAQALPDLQVLSKDTRTVQGAEAKYLLAQHYYNTNDNAKAEAELMNYIENGTPHQYWLARAFILLADVYIRQDDDFQARQYLTSLQNNYKAQDDIAGMIEDRLSKLKK